VDYPKRLIEVDLPIKRISAHARREKSIRHGHISTLHIWWARRPLAACRAVICAALWPDPADEKCPQAFREEARRLMTDWAKNHLELTSPESMSRFNRVKNDPKVLAEDVELRKALLDFIADSANWDNSSCHQYLEALRALTSAAHLSLGGTPNTKPLVVDPFAGGGSIPLEALRVGADAFASDLNPIPVILNKVVLEYIPRFGTRLAEAVDRLGAVIQRNLTADMSTFYPPSEDGRPVGAYLWARTILSDAPDDTGTPVEIPLIRSMLLLKKSGRYRALRWVRDKKGVIVCDVVSVAYGDGVTRKVRRPRLEIYSPASLSDVESGTSSGGAATCPVTGFTTSVESVRRQLASRKGGAGDARMLCAVATGGAGVGRVYRDPQDSDLAAAARSQKELARRITAHQGDLSLIPDGQLNHLRGFFNVVLYGMTTWGDLYSPRQALGLASLVSMIRELPVEGDDLFREAVCTCLALAVDRCADKCASLVVWDNTRDMATHVFGRQALPMIWDFAEVSLLSDNGWAGALEWVRKVIDKTAEASLQPGVVAQASATAQSLPDDSVDAVVSDPPYYAAIPYADLSDFFYSWLKRSVGHLHPTLFRESLSPKADECVSLAHRAAMYRNKDAKWFEEMMTHACAESRRVTKPTGIGVFVFANKETAGWEAMLAALIESGWTITGSWPVDTEMGNRLRARNSAALASSVHLVCRPRENQDGTVANDTVGDWRSVLSELPTRLSEWMPRLADEGVVGADAIFACLGPALEIFSRYSRVEKASGELVTLREYLEQVWAAVSTEALSMIFRDADAAGLESDARFTAIVLWTLGAGGSGSSEPDESGAVETEEEDGNEESPKAKIAKGGYTLEYDAARKIAQGLGINLEQIDSVVEVKGEKARLLPVNERTASLFGKVEKVEAATKKRGKKATQKKLFDKDAEEGSGKTETVTLGDGASATPGVTALDRVHQAMLLFADGRADALKRFIVEDGVGGDARFWKLAQSLSALYPAGSDEKRWVDGVLARKKSFGF
jgi:putative DNA methylase